MTETDHRATTTHFDHTDHDGDRVQLRDANGAMITVGRGSHVSGTVELNLDGVQALIGGAARLLRSYGREPITNEAEPTATDIRRAAALALAKETLGTGMHPPEALITLANWLLGDQAEPATTHINLDAAGLAELQQKLGRRAPGTAV